jgi:hypothetical protein
LNLGNGPENRPCGRGAVEGLEPDALAQPMVIEASNKK